MHPEICKVTFKTFKTNDDYLVDKVHCRIAFEKEIEKLDWILKKKGIKRRVKREQPEVPHDQETGPGLAPSRSEPEGFPGAGPLRPLLGANGHGIRKVQNHNSRQVVGQVKITKKNSKKSQFKRLLGKCIPINL